MESIKVDYDTDFAGNYDPEKANSGDHYRFCETTPTYVRHHFIRKVFFIVAMQLLYSFGFLCMAYNVSPVYKFFYNNIWLSILSFLVFFVVTLVIGFNRTITHNVVKGTVLTIISTVSMSLYMTGIAVHYYTFEIIAAVGITVALVVFLTIFAVQTKHDFTGFITYLYLAFMALISFGILAMIFPSRITSISYCAISSFLVSLYFVIDIQLLVGGKRYEWTIDDYFVASIIIYSDIITLFLQVLRLVGDSRE